MGTIAPSVGGGTGARAVVETTMTASDTLVFRQGAGQMLRLRNTTAGALTVTLTGADAVSANILGGGVVNYAAGITSGVIAATTGDVVIPLDSIFNYLQGVITLTGGTGIKASIVSVS
ncbi:MAG: hypothetical protein Q8K33_24195 [Cypionkella sp.]|uniref:hypothetical protein n=1 Tax=Cypionkella sp. TaxID=2811411 RepID=UPI00273110BD|nr:hypothetical protein [Cypionkella sp.]MDP1620409.1 hypothetical protein [bacterium]MDP2051925.1 hypothetical protein [Cypionkella sp.]